MNLKLNKKLFILSYLVWGFHNFASADGFRIGDIKSSLLNEVEFQKINGKEWMLMDGERDISQTEFGKISGFKTIPDARGRYLRMNDTRTANNLIEGGPKEIGAQQEYSTGLPKKSFALGWEQGHVHEIQPGGIHHHKANIAVSLPGFADQSTTLHSDMPLPSPLSVFYIHPHYAYPHQRYKLVQDKDISVEVLNEGSEHDHGMKKSGGHTHQVDGGDFETRPASLIVNYYLKVNEIEDCLPKNKMNIEDSSKIIQCLKKNLSRWENGDLSLTSSEAAQMVKRVYEIMSTVLSGKLDAKEDLYLKNLLDKYAGFMNHVK